MVVEPRGGNWKVVFSSQAWEQQQALVSACGTELGWYGIGHTSTEDHLIYVEEIYVPQQQVNATRCVLDAEHVENVVLWGHSHVRMACSPSAQDQTTWKGYSEALPFGEYQPFAMIILNKMGDVYMRLATEHYDVVNPPYEVENSELSWAQEQLLKVTPLLPKVKKSSYNYKDYPKYKY